MFFSALLFYVLAATATLAIPTAGEQGAQSQAGQATPVAAAAALSATSNAAQDETTTNWAGVALTFAEVGVFGTTFNDVDADIVHLGCNRRVGHRHIHSPHSQHPARWRRP